MEDDMLLLPYDMILEIFSRLPAKTVGRCTCLSRSWRASLLANAFINMHLNQQLQNHNYQNFLVSSKVPYGCDLHALQLDENDPKNIKLVEMDHPLKSSLSQDFVVSSCNGLLFLEYLGANTIYLWNPCTKEYKKLPTEENQSADEDVYYGFGYIPTIDDYRVVRVRHEPKVVDIYSLNNNSYKQVKDTPYQVLSNGFYVNGVLYWIGSDTADESRYLLLAFDWRKEIFEEVQLPNPMDTIDSAFLNIGDISGQLCVCFNNNFSVQLWVMKEYGIQKSWTELPMNIETPMTKFAPFLIPISYTKNNCIVALVDDDLLLYNPTDKTSTICIRGGFEDAGNYLESLVRLNVT